MSILLVFVLLVVAFCKDPTPKVYSKYYANCTMYNEATYDYHRTEYFIKTPERLGVVYKHFQNRLDENLFHIDVLTPRSYLLFYDGIKFDHCNVYYFNFKELNILDFIHHEMKQYVGEEQCGKTTEKCNFWRTPGTTLVYGERIEGQIPMYVLDERTKKILINFDDFREGDKSFDEEKVFKMPIHPDQCH